MFFSAGQSMWLKMTTADQLHDYGLTVEILELIQDVCAVTIRYNLMSVGVSTGQLKILVSPLQHHALGTMLEVRLAYITGPVATTVMIQLTHATEMNGKVGAIKTTAQPVDRILEEGELNTTSIAGAVMSNKNVENTAVDQFEIFQAYAGSGWTASKVAAFNPHSNLLLARNRSIL